MANGITKERLMQLGQETDKGTAVAATAIWRGPASSILDSRTVEHPDENVGYNVQLSRVYTSSVGAEYAQPDTEVTFEQGPYVLAASIHSLVTGVADGGTSTAKIYDYPFPTKNADHTYKTFTVEAGNNNLAHEMEYGFVDKWGISGASRQALKWTGVHWVGKQRTSTTFTSPLSLVSVEPVLFQMGKLYLNDAAGTLGQTQKTNTWLGFDFACDTGLIATSTGDGSLTFSFAKATGVKATGSLTIEDDAVATGLETDWVANTIKLMRWNFTGSAAGGAGGTYVTKVFQCNMAINIDRVNVLASNNGNDTKKVDFTVVYSIGDSLFADFKFVNLLTVLP